MLGITHRKCGISLWNVNEPVSFDRRKFYLSLSVYRLQKFDLVLNSLEMAFRFLSQLNQNAGYEVEDEDRSSPVDEEEGENEESDIELDPEVMGTVQMQI